MGNRVGKFMSFVVVFVGLSVVGAATALSQTLSLDDQTAEEIGAQVTFTLSIDYPSSESGEIQAITIDVDFDHTVLTYEAHTSGSLVANWALFNVNETQPGQVRVAGLTFTTGDGLEPGDSGAIVQLQFTVDAMDDATLTISAQDDLATFGTRNGQFMFELPPANNPPVASDDMGTTEQGQPVMIDVLANDEDADGESLTITAVTQGDDGAVTHNGATVTYTPNAGFTGADEFTYTVSDGTDDATATVMVTVTAPPPPANNPPVATDDEGMTDEGVAAEIDVLANDSDADGDTLTVTAVTEPGNGAADITDNGTTIAYTPDAGFSGEDQFMYTVSDGESADTATVYVTVEAEVVTPVDPGNGGNGDSDGGGGGSGGGCTLNPGTRFNPTLIGVLAFVVGIHFVRRLTRRQALR